MYMYIYIHIRKVNLLRTLCVCVDLFQFFTCLASLECSHVILPEPCELVHIQTLKLKLSMVNCSIRPYPHPADDLT